MDYFVNILLGISTSIIGTFIFIYLLFKFGKPKFEISNFICKGKLVNSEDQIEYFFIKIINKSKYAAYDVKLFLQKRTYYKTPPNASESSNIYNLDLVSNSIPMIPAYKKSDKNYSENCYTIRTKHDLTSILKDNGLATIKIDLYVKHGLTGLFSVFTQEYSHLNEIKIGRFEAGNVFKQI